MGAVILVNFYYRLTREKKGWGESAVILGSAVIALAVVYGLDCIYMCMQITILIFSTVFTNIFFKRIYEVVKAAQFNVKIWLQMKESYILFLGKHWKIHYLIRLCLDAN